MDDRDSKTEIDQLTAVFFQAFTNRGVGRVDFSGLPRLFLPEALIIKSCGAPAEIYDLEGFLAPRERLLNSGSLVDFEEEEVEESTSIFGNIAQRFSLYQKSGVLDGKPFETRGMKTFQYLRTSAGWRISSVSWDDERPGLEVRIRRTEPDARDESTR